MGGRGARCREGVASLLRRFVSNLWGIKLFSPEEPPRLSVISNTLPGCHAAGWCWAPPRVSFLPIFPSSSLVHATGPSAIVDDFFPFF